MNDLRTYGALLRGPTEADFQAQVTELAELLGWEWVHFRPAQTSKGWRTPVSGSLGKGWPDLLLTRTKDARVIAAELKREGAKPTIEQTRVLGILAYCGIETHVWRPADWDEIVKVLA